MPPAWSGLRFTAVQETAQDAVEVACVMDWLVTDDRHLCPECARLCSECGEIKALGRCKCEQPARCDSCGCRPAAPCDIACSGALTDDGNKTRCQACQAAIEAEVAS